MPKTFLLNGIRGRLFLLLLLVLVPVLLIEGFIYYRAFEKRKSEELQANLELARAGARTFEVFIADVVHTEHIIGLAATASPPPSKDSLRNMMRAAEAVNPMLRSFTWISPEGLHLVTTNPKIENRPIADTSRPEFFRLKSEAWAVTPVFISPITKESVFTISRGIFNHQGKFLGVVSSTAVVDKLDSLLAFKRSKEAGISLIDNKGRLVYRYPATKYTWEQRNWLKHYPMMADSLKGQDVLAGVISELTGRKRLVAFTPVSSIGWVAAASRTEAEVMKTITSSLLFQAGLVLLVTLGGFCAAAALARPISNSIIRLRNQALALGKGETENLALDSGPEELRDLARAFNRMAGEVRSRETALRESEQRWATTLASIGDAVIATDLSGRITFMNRIAQGLTGWPLSEALDKPVAEIFHIINEQTRNRVEDPVAKVLQEGIIVGLANHTVLVGRSGIEIPIDDSGAPIRDPDGSLTGVVLVFHDISEHKKAKHALQESENHLRRFYESGLLGVIYWNMDGEITEANDKFLEMVGYDRADLAAGRIDWARMTPPEYRHRDEESIWELRTFGVNKVPFEKEYLRKDGSRIPVIVAGAMLDEARFNGVAFVLDITARNQAMENLRESETRYRSLFEHMLEGFAYCRMLFDDHGHPEDFIYLNVNDAFGELTGLQGVIGKRVTEVIPRIKEETPELFEIYGRVSLTGRPERFEIDIKSLGLYLSISVYSPAKGYFVAVFDNISERKGAEEALQKQTLELQYLTETLEERVRERTAELADLSSRLVSAQENERRRVSYDLHDHAWQVLVAIRFEIERLFNNRDQMNQAAFRERQNKVMDSLLEAVGKIRSMQGDLWPYVLDDIGILATIDWYCREFEKNHPGLAIERQDDLNENEIPSSAKIVIYRVLQEALSNVAKHSRAGRVILHLREKDRRLEFTIEDDGIGFDLEEVVKRSPWGGLGLLNIKARTELSNGLFEIKSVKGQGTTVRASWPFQENV